ncbi:MAG: glycoside hydrolase family 99-like domain-containing protein [Sulfolobales archaeon]
MVQRAGVFAVLLIIGFVFAGFAGYYLGFSGSSVGRVATTVVSGVVYSVSVFSTITYASTLTYSVEIPVVRRETVTSTVSWVSTATVTNTVTNVLEPWRYDRSPPVVRGFGWDASRVINDKIYDIGVWFSVFDDRSPIAYVELRFIPERYYYFITGYGMRPEDYDRVFPPENERTYILKPVDGGFDELEEDFEVEIRDIVGGREYRIIVIARDLAGNVGVFETKTPYIRQYENVAKLDNILVIVHYYPWYSTSRHWNEGYKGNPLLGNYDSQDPIVISKHIDWATGHGIDAFLISWWGPYSFEDLTLRKILENPLADNIRIGILYESLGRLKVLRNEKDEIYIDMNDPDNVNILLSDLKYLAKNYFNSPNYLYIKESPVIELYLARIYKGDIENVISILRKEMKLYLLADLVYWQNPSSEKDRIKVFDGITSYNMHTNVPEILKNFEYNLDKKYKEWSTVAEELNVDFLPSVIPGFDDSAVRSTNYPLPKSEKRFIEQLQIAKKYNPSVVVITSFNEWHEYTQIEPDREEYKKYLEVLLNFIRSG